MAIINALHAIPMRCHAVMAITAITYSSTGTCLKTRDSNLLPGKLKEGRWLRGSSDKSENRISPKMRNVMK
jgi:hypothetical protein